MNLPRIHAVTRPSSKRTHVLFHAKGAAKIAEVSEKEFSGAKFSTCWVRGGSSPTLHVGLGAQDKWGEDVFRQAAGVAIKTLLKLGVESCCFDLRQTTARVQAVVEGAVLAAYRFEEFKDESARRKGWLRDLEIWVNASSKVAASSAAQVGEIMANAANITRSIGNLPPNVIYPSSLASRAQKLATALRVRCRVWTEKQLSREGFGGILAVGQGSVRPPRLIQLEVPAPSKNCPTIVVVGKAVTFDTGGISIKPADRMEEMKWDKMGGCAVLGIIQAVRHLKLPIRLIGVIPSAENMPSANAYRPSDLVKTWDGKVIEVLNTDAEGRVILADALAYARDTFKPDLMIDMATLTGACVVALGGRRAGMFTQDETLRRQLFAVGEDTGDRVWPLPMGEEFDEQIRSDVGLVKNTGGREGGACTAASFLKHWAGDTRWVHLDIAGPAATTREWAHLEKGATGFGVRLVTEFLRRHSKELMR